MDAARKHYPISVEMYHIMAERGAAGRVKVINSLAISVDEILG